MQSSIGSEIVGWYLKNRRPLPWREEKSAYRVWLSEIILQQTRVNQGLPYFEAFVEQYPRIQDLASAPLDEVLRLWQGLGYYSRARNLHKCAQTVVEDHGGIFPKTAKELQDLPGIGPYTAAAIASICFGEATPVVDGNVLRLITRLQGIREDIRLGGTQKAVGEVAESLIEGNNPEFFNQGMMELGSLVCKPKSPACEDCPIQVHCSCFSLKAWDQIPYKSPAKKAKERTLSYYLVHNKKGQFIAEQRTNPKDIWNGLYQLSTQKPSSAAEPEARYELAAHKLSHQTIKAEILVVEVDQIEAQEHQIVTDLQSFKELAKPQILVKQLDLLEKIVGT